MSLFIASLAFNDSAHLTAAKLGVLSSSIIAGVVGWILLRIISPKEGAESSYRSGCWPPSVTAGETQVLKYIAVVMTT